MTEERYSLIQRLLHWAIALLVLGALAGGMVMDNFKAKDLPPGLYNQVYDLHKSVGVVVLALMIVRIAVRLSHGAPAPHPALADWQRLASNIVHFGFYALLIVQPVLGVIGVWAFPAPIPIFDSLGLDNPLTKDRELSKTVLELHEIFGKALIALALLHIGGAAMHILKGDGVMRRMGFGNSERETGGG